jgi:hypothetical protein
MLTVWCSEKADRREKMLSHATCFITCMQRGIAARTGTTTASLLMTQPRSDHSRSHIANE